MDGVSSDHSMELNEALNVIGKYCIENMPDGWQLTIDVINGEMSCDLADPDGDTVEGWESTEGCPIVDACDFAQHAQLD